MDWAQIAASVLGSSALVGVLSALFTHRLAMRKQDADSEAKFRDELRSIIREERAETHACEAKVEKLQTEVTESRIAAARWETRCLVIEGQMAEIRTAILREYVKSGAAGTSLPPPAHSE